MAALLRNQWLMEQLRLNRKKQFDVSSEQMDQLMFEQFGRVFNESEEVVEHRLEDRACPQCGSEMVELGKEVRRTL